MDFVHTARFQAEMVLVIFIKGLGHEVEMMMFGGERRSARVLMLGVMLLVCTGCTSEEEPQTKEMLAATSAASALQEEPRQPKEHPSRFVPEEVREGDKVAGLTVRSVKVGQTPMYHVIMELDGELKMTGRYSRGPNEVYFYPDEATMDRIPQVAGTKSPWTERYRFEFAEGKKDLGEAQLGKAEVVTKSYTLRYVPDADSQKGLLENGQSYLVLGNLKLSFEHERRMQDVAKPISIRVMERFHEITAEQESNALKSGWNEYRWKGMKVQLDTLNLWHPNREKPYVGGLIGNHAEVLRTETVQKDGRNLFYLEVERDRYDEKTMSYNGEMNYEYWLVAVYEDASASRLSEDRQTALTLVLTSEKEELPGAKAQLLELAKTWSLPPEDIFME
jgi:hypothetical protein